VEASAVPQGRPGWNAEGHPVIPVAADEVAALARRARRYLVF
jgi:hypothetical protein